MDASCRLPLLVLGLTTASVRTAISYERPSRAFARAARVVGQALRPIIRTFVLTPRLKVALWMLFWLGVAILAAALARGIASPVNEGGA